MPEAVGVFRYRINLTTTVKDGYRVGDATVEFTEAVPGSTKYPEGEIYRRLRELIADGECAANDANRTKDQQVTN